MRAALLLLFVACATQDSEAPIAIDIVTGRTVVVFYISPGTSCTCQSLETFPPVGGCSQSSDEGPSCTCYPGACLTAVAVMQGDFVISDTSTAQPVQPITELGIPGDLAQPDLALRFRGCGEDATVALDDQFPDSVSSSATSDGAQVSWTPVPNDGFLVQTHSEYDAELCRTAPDASSVMPHVAYTAFDVETLRGPIASTAGNFSFRVWTED